MTCIDMVGEILSRLLEEDRLDRNVLNSLLLLSTKDTKHETNTIKERILRATANGLLAYLGSSEKISQDDGKGYNYEYYVARVVDKNKDRMDVLQPRLRESFERLFKANRIDYALGETGTTIGMYRYIPEFIKLSFRPIISLSYSFVSEAENNGVFSEKEFSQLMEIAARMAPALKEETDFIKYERENPSL